MRGVTGWPTRFKLTTIHISRNYSRGSIQLSWRPRATSLHIWDKLTNIWAGPQRGLNSLWFWYDPCMKKLLGDQSQRELGSRDTSLHIWVKLIHIWGDVGRGPKPNWRGPQIGWLIYGSWGQDRPGSGVVYLNWVDPPNRVTHMWIMGPRHTHDRRSRTDGRLLHPVLEKLRSRRSP